MGDPSTSAPPFKFDSELDSDGRSSLTASQLRDLESRELRRRVLLLERANEDLKARNREYKDENASLQHKVDMSTKGGAGEDDTDDDDKSGGGAAITLKPPLDTLPHRLNYILSRDGEFPKTTPNTGPNILNFESVIAAAAAAAGRYGATRVDRRFKLRDSKNWNERAGTRSIVMRKTLHTARLSSSS